MKSPRSPEQLLVRPLFYHALSGEFQPKGDPRGSKQTLGRLAFDAFTEGQLIVDEDTRDADLTAITYRPDWAPQTTATIYLETAKDVLDHDLYLLDGLFLDLDPAGDAVLSVIDDSLDSDSYGVLVDTLSSHNRLQLTSNGQLGVVQAHVATEAQLFFDAAYAAAASA